MNQNIQHIKRLLSLYESGLSSLSDDRELLRLLSETEQLPEELQSYADIVKGMSMCPEVDVPPELAHTLSTTIDRMDREYRSRRRGSRWITISGIAASVAIVASVAGFIFIESKNNPYEVTDPEEASRFTREALMTVAQGFRDADKAIEESCLILNSIISIEPSDSIDNDSPDEESITENIPMTIKPGDNRPNRI